MWRTFNCALLDYIAERFPGPILIPMTVTDRRYYQELTGALAEKYEIKHFILYASKKTLLRRLASRLEGSQSWAARQIDRCIQAFDGDAAGYKIHTDGMRIEQVAEQIAALSGIPLLPDRRNRLQKNLDRILCKWKHIR